MDVKIEKNENLRAGFFARLFGGFAVDLEKLTSANTIEYNLISPMHEYAADNRAHIAVRVSDIGGKTYNGIETFGKKSDSPADTINSALGYINELKKLGND